MCPDARNIGSYRSLSLRNTHGDTRIAEHESKRGFMKDSRYMLGLPKRVFMVSDLIAYAFNIPVTIMVTFVVLDVSGQKILVFFPRLWLRSLLRQAP